MAPTDAANALQGNRPRPSTIRPIVPAIPLPYIQKRKQYATAPAKIEVVPAPVSSADTPKPTSLPVVDISPHIANGQADATGHTEVEAEPPPVTPIIQQAEDSADDPADEVPEAIAEISSAGE